MWSIVFWSLTTLFGGINQFPGSILFYIGGAGPLVSAIIITHLFESKENQKDFWSRTLNAKRIPWRWMVPALLLHPSIIFAAGLIETLLDGELQYKISMLSNPISLLTLVLSVFILGPLPEEMGWRGVGYDRLIIKMTPLSASIILGFFWAAWHVPLFFIENTFHYELGLGSLRFWIFLLSNIPLTIIITWIYNHTDRSVLMAAIVHFSGNIVGAILPKSDRLALLELFGLILSAIVIGIATGPELSSKKNSTPKKLQN
jgi:membrane protease YdiL (CAAX protease family)